MNRIAAFACGLALIAACGGGGGGGGGGGQSATACEPVLAALTAKFSECFEASPAWTRAELGGCTPSAVSLPSGRVRYDAARGSACAAAIQAASCDTVVTIQRNADCASALVGTVPNGGACADDIECAAGSCTADRRNGTCPGQCVAFAPAGAACDSDEQCGPGNVCAGTTARACAALTAPGAQGQPCANDFSCQPGLFCRFPSTTCDRRSAASEACDDDVLCTAGLVCAGGSQPAGRTCTPFVAAGAPCTPGTVPGLDSVCAFGTVCDAATSTCTAQPAAGEPCTQDGPKCLGGWCNAAGSRCEPWTAVGAPCTNPDQCQSGLCVPGAAGASVCQDQGFAPVCSL